MEHNGQGRYMLLFALIAAVVLVFALVIFPTHIARNQFRKEISERIHQEFRALFPDDVWHTFNNFPINEYGDTELDTDGAIIYHSSIDISDLDENIAKAVKDLLTNPYNYGDTRNLQASDYVKINKYFVIYPFGDINYPVLQSYSVFRPSIFIPSNYFKFSNGLVVLISNESGQIGCWYTNRSKESKISLKWFGLDLDDQAMLKLSMLLSQKKAHSSPR